LIYAEWQGGDRIIVTCSPRDRDMIRAVPGALYDRAGFWTVPLGWGSCLALRGVFGSELEVGPKLNDWAHRKRATQDQLELIKAGNITHASLDERLRPKQRAGVTFLMEAGAVILADEMRAGKTPQTITAVRHADALPCLIVAPNSVLLQWADEIQNWWPGRRISVIAGTKTQREAAMAPGFDFYLIGWANVWRHSRLSPYGSTVLSETERKEGLLNALDFKAVIADEAHRALNPKAKQTRALWHLMHRAEYRYALTGTPVRNDGPEDVWAIGHLVAPEDYPRRSAFIDRYALSGSNGFGFEVFGWNQSTKDEALAVLDTHLLRRTYAEVFPDTPTWAPPDVRKLQLTGKQAKAYKEMQKHMMTQLESGILLTGDPLVKMGRLSQIAAAMPVLDAEGNVTELEEPSAKIDALLEVIGELPGEPLVVFAASRKLIELAARVLTKHKISHGLITGPTPMAERKLAVDRFQAGEIQVILATMGAGAEGLTLNRANRILFLQRSFSLTENIQAEVCIGGMAQTRPMQCIDLVCEGTMDAAVLEAVFAKEQNLQDVVRDKNWIRRQLT